MLTGASFLRGVVAAFTYKLHTALTDNGVPFTDRQNKRSGPTAQYRLHVFDRICRENGITHKLTNPITHGQTVKPSGRTAPSRTPPCGPFHYETLDSLKAHLDAFITAYNFAKYSNRSAADPFQAPPHSRDHTHETAASSLIESSRLFYRSAARPRLGATAAWRHLHDRNRA